MIVFPIIAVAISAILIVSLCLGDPKRRRSLRMAGTGQTPTTRRLFAIAACIPGLLCAFQGDAAAFLIWLGGSSAVGWLIALWFNRQDVAR